MTGLKPRTRWVVGLSNGSVVTEGVGVAARIVGEDSPWIKLQAHLEKEGLEITSLGIHCRDQHYYLPTVGNRFGSELPVRYSHFRRVSMDFASGVDSGEFYSCAEAIYPKYKLRLWVSELDPNKTWVSIHDL